MILGWQENLVREEQPPRWMWAFDEELEVWFDRVDQQRNTDRNSSAESGGGGMMQNELLEGRR